MMIGTKIRGIILCLCSLSAVAQVPPSILATSDLDRNVNTQLEFQLDETNSLLIEQIRQHQENWQVPASDNLTFGLGPTTVWARLNFNNAEKTGQNLYLEFNPVFLEKIEVFDESGKSLDLTGSTVAFKRLEGFPTVQVPVPPGNSVRYVSIKSRSNALSVRIRSEEKQHAKSNFDLAIFSLLLGGLLLLMTYHLFLFATYRNWTYLFYSVFIAATMHFTISFCSFHKYLLPSTFFGFPVAFWWSALSAPLLLFSMFVFSAKLLDLFPRRPYLTRQNRNRLLLLTLPAMEVACVIAVFVTDSATTLIPVRFSSLLHLLVLPTVALVLWNRERSNTISLYYAFSWVPFGMGVFLIVAWLSGAVKHNDLYSWAVPIGALFQSLLLSFAAGQQLNVVTRDKLKEQKHKLRLMDELKIEVNKLNRRDRVITAFVSSDIVEELDRGEDPLVYEPQNVNRCIVFIDMHNYTTLVETYSPLECQKILNQFFRIINDTTYENGGKVDKIVGDAMMLVFSDPQACLRSIVQLRREISKANRERYLAQKTPLNFGLGVSHGTMLSANFGSSQKLDRTLVGDSVNVASRLETITRLFSVDVLCSKEFIELQSSYQYCRPAGYVLLKGRQKKSLVYECFEHQPPQVVEWKISTKPSISEAVELELNARYTEALAVIQSLIDICPPHTRKSGVTMDPTLEAMVGAVVEKLRQLGMPVPSMDSIRASQGYRRAA